MRPTVKVLAILVCLITVVMLTACISGCHDQQVVKVGDLAPEISGNDLQGRTISLDQFKGKVGIIFFWTNSCCGASVKQLEPLYRQFRQDGLEIVAVNELDAQKVVDAYARDNALTFPMLADEGSKLFKRYHVFGFPTIFILDRTGIVREKIMGEVPSEKLKQMVTRRFAINKEIEANYEKAHSR